MKDFYHQTWDIFIIPVASFSLHGAVLCAEETSERDFDLDLVLGRAESKFTNNLWELLESVQSWMFFTFSSPSSLRYNFWLVFCDLLRK